MRSVPLAKLRYLLFGLDACLTTLVYGQITRPGYEDGVQTYNWRKNNVS